MISAIDSHFMHVLTRLQTINPDRKVNAIMDARDWPPQTIPSDQFYLLVLGSAPMPKRSSSIAEPTYIHTLQWTWVVIGTDIDSGDRGANRGDRYRTHLTMMDELRQALYPHFAEKLIYSADATGAVSSQSMEPSEFMLWSQPVFQPQRPDDSGVIYGFATIYLTDMTGLIAA